MQNNLRSSRRKTMANTMSPAVEYFARRPNYNTAEYWFTPNFELKLVYTLLHMPHIRGLRLATPTKIEVF